MSKKILSLCLILTLLFPLSAEAKNPFRQFFRNLRRGVNFVVNLPNKATRWMGPVLGPIAADILTQNIIRNPNFGRIFSRAQRINSLANNVEEQRKVLQEVQSSLRTQADQLRNESVQIRNFKETLKTNLLSGQMTLSEYQQKVVAIDNLAESYELAADKFTRSADKIEPNNLVRLVGRNAFRQTLSQIKTGIQFEIKSALGSFIKPEVILTLVAVGDRDADTLLDAMLSGDISAFLAGQGSGIDSNQFRDRVRDRVKDILKNNKNNLKNNWRQEIQKVLNRVKADLEKERKNLPDLKTIISPTPEVSPTLSVPIPTTAGGCQPGYTPCPRCGITCIQANCNQIPSGHYSYESYCICGSSGSIAENPKDPNKECNYPPDYAACPGCLYACVHLDSDCPPAP